MTSRSTLMDKARTSRYRYASECLSMYVGVGLFVGIGIGMLVKKAFLQFDAPFFVATIAAYTTGIGITLVVRHYSVHWPLPSTESSFKEVVAAEVKDLGLGAAPSWMAAPKHCSRQLKKYVKANLSSSEQESFWVLAEESDVSVDELFAVVRLL